MKTNKIRNIVVWCLIIVIFGTSIVLLSRIFENTKEYKEINLGDSADCCLDSSVCEYWVSDASCKQCGSRCVKKKNMANATTPSINNSPTTSNSNTNTNNNNSSNQSSVVDNCISTCVAAGVPRDICSSQCASSTTIKTPTPNANGNTSNQSSVVDNCISACVAAGVPRDICSSQCSTATGKATPTPNVSVLQKCQTDADCSTNYCNPQTHLCEKNNSSQNNNNQTNNNTNNNQQQEETAQCYVKRNVGTNNIYCYGTSEKCSGFSEIASGKTEYDCNENDACYEKTDGTYVLGKFDKQSEYKYYGMTCPACYEKENGDYYWTNTPKTNEKVVSEINTSSKCVTPNKSIFSTKKIIFIVLIVVVAIALFVVLKSLKNDNQDNNY